MSFGAIARTRILRAKAGTTMAVDKWWKKQRPAEGEVRTSSSSYNWISYVFTVSVFLQIGRNNSV